MIMRDDRLYLGTAIAFPMVVVDGRLLTVSGNQAVEQSVKDILCTQIGEVFFNREYGSDVDENLFELCDEVAANMIELSIAKALDTWEKRVKFVSSETVLDDERVHVTVNYRILGQNELKSTAYTYYRNGNGT